MRCLTLTNRAPTGTQPRNNIPTGTIELTHHFDVVSRPLTNSQAMSSEQDTRDKVEKTILDIGADRTIVGPGWTVFDQHDECVGKTPYYGGTGAFLPTVDAVTLLLLKGTTLEPTGLLMCYNAIYDKDGGNTRESLISTTQMERSGIEVNAKQRCFGYLQNIIFPDKRVLDLECNGMSFWLYNRKPSKGELQTWLARKDAIYIFCLIQILTFTFRLACYILKIST